MKTTNKILAWILTVIMLVSLVPTSIFAEKSDDYSITNGYLTYTFNSKTGGFSIDTVMGHPQKSLDDNIPLLYKEDKERSNGTSFVSVRIDGKDYIFGQDYSHFLIPSSLETPTIEEDGRLINIRWTIKGITVIKSVALSRDQDSDITGNAGISFEVINNSGAAADVGIRLLLDTALGEKVDAPYMVVDKELTPRYVETEFTGEDVPEQIRNVNSIARPTVMSYLITKGWQAGIEPNRVILGHWANIANTKYEYTADPYCDFTNYSNDHSEPDSAAAVYWEKNGLASGASFKGETLYGIGNFSSGTVGENIGINITAERVELAADGKSYKNDGVIKVKVEIDNTLSTSNDLTEVMLAVTFDEKDFESGYSQEIARYTKLGKEIVMKEFTLKALPQDEITAGEIYVTLNATESLKDGSTRLTETLSERSVILPSVKGSLATVSMREVNPKIVYTLGEKTVTITGDMKAFESLTEQGWLLKLYHKETGEFVVIDKKDISFLDDKFRNMTFKTTKELIVGDYEIVFEFTDPEYIKAFGKSITAAATLGVSADPIYAIKSYGIIALVRMTPDNSSDYDFFTFNSEAEYQQFYDGELAKVGRLNGKTVKHDFGASKGAIKSYEILATVRGNLVELERPKGTGYETYWQANVEDGVVINNILAYEGDVPLEIYREDNDYIIEGDGLVKVVNSINVWRSKWQLQTVKGMLYTLDESRLNGIPGPFNTMRLELEGAGMMIQSIGGFLLDLKFGDLSSQWYDDSDGRVTYGINFGGSVSVPISAGEKKDDPSVGSLTADQEDYSDAFANMFNEDDGATNKTDTNQTTKSGKKVRKESGLPEGQLGASINNVRFGEEGSVKDGKVSVDKTGFVGIDTTVELSLPQDLLGSLVTNAPGISVAMTINTIKNYYELNVGISVKIIECEATLAFKETRVKGKDAIVPDKIKFYIRDGLMIPVGPPATPLYIVGLGGGIEGLADTIGGNFSKLPPLTIFMGMNLRAINILDGEFNAQVNLQGLSLDGNMTIRKFEELLQLQAGLSARWADPWGISLYGNISVLKGIIRGGLTVDIAEDYFYGYVYAGIFIPDEIPVIGGKELAGVEAAVSHEFIGANVKIIGIKYGVIYYWGDNVKFSKNIDLGAPKKKTKSAALENIDAAYTLEDGESGMMSYYGTNLHALSVNAGGMTALDDGFKSVDIDVDSAEGEDALLFEIPYTGTGSPKAEEIILVSPTGGEIPMVADDNEGGGNFILQDIDGRGKFMYITVTDPAMIKNGSWKLKYMTENIEVGTIRLSGVDNISELRTIEVSKGSDNFKLNARWTADGDMSDATSLDVYLTKNKNILKDIRTSSNEKTGLGDKVLHLENPEDIKKGGAVIEIPDSYESGTYYAVAMLSTMQGATVALTANSFDFTNPNLPMKVESVKVKYGGNGNLYVEIADPANADYTHYLVEIKAEDNTYLTNNFNQYKKGDNLIFIGKEANLKPNKKYRVNVRTLREEKVVPTVGSTDAEKMKFFYGADMVSSEYITIPEMNKPKLLKVETNYDTSKENISQNSVMVKYTFDQDVWMEVDVRGQKHYFDDEFKSVWEIELDDLEDGDYIVDFTAFSKSKDYATGAEFESGADAVKDARLGFTVDSSKPVLALAQKRAESIAEADGEKIEAVFGSNVIIAESDGRYTVEGMAEQTATLTVDGTEQGLTRNGTSFEYSDVLGADEAVREHLIKAVDKAGNVSEMIVTVISGKTATVKSIILMADGKEIAKDENGMPSLELKRNGSVKLSAVGVTDSGEKVVLSDDLLEYSLLYEKGAAVISEGKLTAVSSGETAVKVKLLTGTVIREDGSALNTGLEDYAVIEIEEAGKAELKAAIENAETELRKGTAKTEAAKEALKAEIEAAKAVYEDISSVGKDYTDAITALNNAVSAFKNSAAVKPGTQGGSSGSGGGTGSGSYFNKENTYSTNKKPKWNPFTDVTEKDWFYSVVKTAYEDDLMNGTSQTLFSPDSDVTRGMFVTVLYRMEGEPRIGTSMFTDIPGGAYYEKAVAWANAHGIVKGVTSSKFAPDSKISREQMAAILYRYADYKQYGVSEGEDTNILSYKDAMSISEYAIAPMQWALGSGVMNGKGDGILDPKGFATRAEAAAVLTRVNKK